MATTRNNAMALQEIDIDYEEVSITDEASRFIEAAEAKIELFWDRFSSHKVHQFVACDFRVLYGSIRYLIDHQLLDGRNFCEWGAGFGVVAGLAELSGMEAVGIEAEPFLVEEGIKLLREHKLKADLWCGNFLPDGAESLAEPNNTYTCLHHNIAPAYDHHDLGIDDFSAIFVYPWPGEEGFLMDVFDVHARPGAVFLLFRGPYHVEAYRKIKGRRTR